MSGDPIPSHPAPDLVPVRRALLSVSDKRGIVDFARGLVDLGVELVSTGGTAAELAAAGLKVRAIEDFTGFPEMMDGRVKTLHPKLYAGLLAVRDNPEHAAAAHEHGIEMVDLVCVNLYPFERTVAKLNVEDRDAIENIDIGGPTMIRATAKNHAYTAVVVKPESYDAVLEELRENEGALSFTTRQELAAQAFHDTARYDTAIARWFAERSDDFPPLLVRAYEKVTDLSYGENPHQRAAYYAGVGARTHLLSMVKQHHGKQLSFNNLLDLDSARALARDFDEPVCTIVKHNNPCGAATGEDALDAYRAAFECDPLSAFGGVIAFNREVDEATAQTLHQQFIEVLIAPGYTDGALEVLKQKQNIRILEDQERRAGPAGGDAGSPGPGRDARAGARHGPPRARRHVGRDEARADRAGVVGPPVRVAGLQAREVQRDHPRRERLHDRDRCGPDEPRGFGAPRPREVPSRLGGRARSSRRTRSSRSPTVRLSRSRPVCGRSSSPVGPSATTRSSRQPTQPVSRWS